MNHWFKHLSILFLLGQSTNMACDTEPSAQCMVTADVESEHIDLQRISAFEGPTDKTVSLVGYGQATPASTRVRLLERIDADQNESTFTSDGALETISDAQGRFSLSIPQTLVVVSVQFIPPNGEMETISFRVRNRESAFTCFATSISETGTLPNDTHIASCDGQRMGYVVTSADATLEAAAPAGDQPTQEIHFFPPQEQVGANPYHGAWHPTKNLTAVSLFGTSTVAIINPCTGEKLFHSPPWSQEGDQFLLTAEPPLQLTTPIDVNGDGAPDPTVTSMFPRSPQALTWIDDALWVIFSGFIEGATPEQKAVFGPAALVIYHWNGTSLDISRVVALPHQNPQSVTAGNDDSVWISYSGVVQMNDAGFFIDTPGYLEKRSADDASLLHVISMDHFGPSTPAISADKIVTGSLLNSQIAILPTHAESIQEATVIEVEGAQTESLFDVALWGTDVAFITQFSTDRVHVVDLQRDILNPFPFPEKGIDLSRGRSIFHGAQSIDINQNSSEGDLGVVLLGLSAELVFLDFRQVFGP